MVLPVFFIANLGRIIPIVAGIGTALFGFVAKNPKIIGATVSLQAISNAIQSLGATEKEKIDIVNDIGKKIHSSNMTFTEIYFILIQA